MAFGQANLGLTRGKGSTSISNLLRSKVKLNVGFALKVSKT